ESPSRPTSTPRGCAIEAGAPHATGRLFADPHLLAPVAAWQTSSRPVARGACPSEAEPNPGADREGGGIPPATFARILPRRAPGGRRQGRHIGREKVEIYLFRRRRRE